MTTYYVDNSGGNDHWQTGTAYGLGDVVCAREQNTDPDKRHLVYECTTNGTSHAATEPTWNETIDGTTNDNDVVWTTRQATSWTLAHPSFWLLVADALRFGAGDVIKIHDAHNEALTADGYTPRYMEGNSDDPVIVVCVDKDNADALSSGAVCQTNVEARLNGFNAVFINVQFIASSFTYYTGASFIQFISIGTPLTGLRLTGSGTSIGAPDTGHLLLTNTDVRLDNANNYFFITSGNFLWKGGTLIAPNGVTCLISPVVGKAVFEDIDLSQVGNNGLVDVNNSGMNGALHIDFLRCKLPSPFAGLKGTALETYPAYDFFLRAHHCSSQNRTWEFYESMASGDIEASNSIYRNGGASDGTTPISHKMVSNTHAKEIAKSLWGPEITFWNESTSEITLSVHGVLDSANNLQDDELWLEVSYPADASSGLGAFETTRKLPTYETPADLTSSTETWTGTDGFSNENKFKLSAIFIPGKAGPITARVCMGKASTTIYICPKVEIS